MSQGPLMVLDSAGLWFRAFHSVPEKITGPDGAPANAVRGFCDMVAVLVEEYSPTGLVAALDRQWRPDWRVELLPSYKAHRVGDDGEEDAPASLG
ncbi:MAG: 5'-3' exonuclease, partial [Dietzia sp.]|nr:5'-3' exonuclease [Dietzia sp.]